jgi:sarcosine oxidase, subunit beta
VSVLIIGGGVAGTSIAYHLGLKAQQDVLLLERNTLASGSSSKSDGIVERQLISEFDILMRVKSFEILPDFFKTKGVDFTPIGYLRLTSDERDIPKYRESVRIQHSLGVTDSKFVERDEIKKILPFLRVDDLLGALYGPSDGMTDGSLLAASFAREAEKFGASIFQRVSVRGIKRQTGGGRRFHITTDQGDVDCDYVVNAAGAWAASIGKFVGAEIPVKAVRRQIVVLDVPYQNAGRMPFFIDMKSRLYMHGSGGGNTVHSGVHIDVDNETETGVNPESYDPGVDFKFTEQVAEAIEDRAPGLSGAAVKGGWAGLYEITPDSRPILGEVPDLPGFVNCTGFSGYGIQLSPVAGKLVSELIVDGRTETIKDISPLDIRRFGKMKGYSLF